MSRTHLEDRIDIRLPLHNLSLDPVPIEVTKEVMNVSGASGVVPPLDGVVMGEIATGMILRHGVNAVDKVNEIILKMDVDLTTHKLVIFMPR